MDPRRRASSWRRFIPAATEPVVNGLSKAAPRIGRWHATWELRHGSNPTHLAMLRRYYEFLADGAGTTAQGIRLGVHIVGGDPASARRTRRSVEYQLYQARDLLAPPLDGSAAPGHADYIVVLTAGDVALPHAFAELVRSVNVHERDHGARPSLVYCDEVHASSDGRPIGDPGYKPAWSPQLQARLDLLTGVVAVGADIVGLVGDPPRRGGIDLRRWLLDAVAAAPDPPVHVPVIGCVRRYPVGTRQGERPGDVVSVAEQSLPPGVAADVTMPAPGVLRIKPTAGGRTPRVSVIIPTRDNAVMLSACLRSLHLRTDYPDLEIVVVDNGSADPAALAEIDAAARAGARVLRQPGPFNFGALCNAGARAATGDLLVLLNDDTEALSPDWVREMVLLAQQSEIGVVGAQLRYPNGRIQHAGLVGLGSDGVRHAFVGDRPERVTPLHALGTVREVLAVTGACIMVRREVWNAVGGLDEDVLVNDAGDIDLCLRVRRQGYSAVYTPHAVLVHHESASRGRSIESFARRRLMQTWPDEILNDPYLNPNLQRSTRWWPDPALSQPLVPPDLLANWLSKGQVTWDD